jgi:predicted nucleotidyltransferase
VTTDGLVELLGRALAGRGEVRFAFVFGSAVSRGPDQARDVDLAVSFRGCPSLFELGALATEIESVLGREVDLVDLDAASTLLRWEVLRTGRPVAAPDRDAFLEFQARVPIEWADLRPYFERESVGLREALAGRRWSGSTS